MIKANGISSLSEDMETEDQFVYGWEFFTTKGSSIPLAGLISSAAVAEGSALHLTDAKDPAVPVFGRCVVARKAGDDTRYFSPHFQVGGECKGEVRYHMIYIFCYLFL